MGRDGRVGICHNEVTFGARARSGSASCRGCAVRTGRDSHAGRQRQTRQARQAGRQAKAVMGRDGPVGICHNNEVTFGVCARAGSASCRGCAVRTGRDSHAGRQSQARQARQAGRQAKVGTGRDARFRGVMQIGEVASLWASLRNHGSSCCRVSGNVSELAR